MQSVLSRSSVEEFKGIEVDQDEEDLFQDALERIASLQFKQSPAEALRTSKKLQIEELCKLASAD